MHLMIARLVQEKSIWSMATTTLTGSLGQLDTMSRFVFLSLFNLFLPFPGIQSDLDRQLMEEQWEMLCQMMGDKTAFVFGKQGCLTDTELHTALKVGCAENRKVDTEAHF